ncbi:hypothetical protein BH09MYX1_BH09MYX1_02850 [soil metagenome]
MRRLVFLAVSTLASCFALAASAGAAEPHRSTGFLPSANGRASIAFDVAQNRLTQHLEHPYRFPNATTQTRDVLFDSYAGVRVGSTGTWLTSVAPTKIEYLSGTGVIHVVRLVSGLRVDEYDFAPMGLADNASFTILVITRLSGSGAIDAYALMNYHLGAGSPEPSASGEGTQWNALRDAFYEYGPSALAVGHGSIGASSHHGTNPSPYTALLGGQNLSDDSGNGSKDDQVPGFQQSLGDIAINATVYAGFYSVIALDADAEPAVDRVRTFIASRTPKQLVDDEVAGWAAWRTAAPSGLSADETSLFAQSQAFLRMGQVTEPGKSDGQILASLAPGKWNIAWVRDMAYATVGLVRTGHFAEAKKALQFQLGATVGGYQSYVGAPYQISVVRYYGDGTEESDSNQDGPNVEFDGFGLFLWALDEYVAASNDSAFATAVLPAVKTKVADVLVKLQEPSGLIAADSSIWEVHWNGKQQHFAYTSLTAARGLCGMTNLGGDASYMQSAMKVGVAILEKLRAPNGAISQSTESLAEGKGFLDAAAIEAVSLGLADAAKRTARATVMTIAAGLVPPSGRGFFRNDDGDGYDSQEWIFVDLRMGRALDLVGNVALAKSTRDWNVAQATENFGVLSELHDRVTADYAGEAPMIGFGAGGYVLMAKPATVTKSCLVMIEPDEPKPDAGADAGDGGTIPANDGGDGGSTTPPTPADDGGCNAAGTVGSGGSGASSGGLVSWLGVLSVIAMLRRRRARSTSIRLVPLAVLPLAALLVGCSDPANPSSPDGSTEDAGVIDGAPDVPLVNVDGGACLTTFLWNPPLGTAPKAVALAGEWNAFDKSSSPMTGPDTNGAFTAKVPLAPGLVAYKVVVDGSFRLDDGARFRKDVNGTENSAIDVVDCYAPTLAVQKHDGAASATVSFRPGAAQTGVDPATVKATLRHDATVTVLTPEVDVVSNIITVKATLPGDGKYTVVVDAKDRLGRAAAPMRLVSWKEPTAFDWHDAIIYMAVTYRFKNGDPTNDVAKVQNVDLRANFQNGDLEGVRQVIASGALDDLGVRALWLTPFQTNPTEAYPSDDGIHSVTGYHGYWPIKAREADPRLGGDAALKKLVAEAHAHGIRVLTDFVVNHVHEKHDYFKAHPDWFRTGCVCGTNNCDWTEHRLDCLFAPYLPDVNWSVPEVSAQFASDAIYWVDTFDLDGLRIDAVKHVEDAAVMNLSARLRDAFEASGTKLFLTGETAMGWSDCGLACNQDQYDTISRYIGPHGLDGQFDFVLYHAVPYRTLTGDGKGMLHADYWAQASGWMYPQGAIMTPYIGSHDTARSVTIASYRGQDGSHSQSVPGNKWDNASTAPPDAESYARHRLALAWLLGQPGAPLLYYGDEYGEWGGTDPNNRAMYRTGSDLASEELTTLAFTKKLGKARQELIALRQGGYKHVYADEDVVVFARQAGAAVALVALSRASAGRTVVTPLPQTLGLAEGATFTDRIAGGKVVVQNGALTITLGAFGTAVYGP